MAPVATPDGHVELATDNLTATLYRLTGWAVERGIELDELSVVRPTLEDVYLELTGARPDAAGGDEPAEGAAGSHARRGGAGRTRTAKVR